jgi:Cu/Ag efflux protein CusF
MNKAIVLLAGALATLSLVGPAFAQSTAPAAKEPSAPAEKPGAQKDQSTQQLTASVVSVNPDAKTLTVKRGSKGKELTFAVESGAATHLGDLKTGDQVKISYRKAQNKLMAKEVVRSEATKSK